MAEAEVEAQARENKASLRPGSKGLYEPQAQALGLGFVIEAQALARRVWSLGLPGSGSWFSSICLWFSLHLIV